MFPMKYLSLFPNHETPGNHFQDHFTKLYPAEFPRAEFSTEKKIDNANGACYYLTVTTF